jgi:hypothetical protein
VLLPGRDLLHPMKTILLLAAATLPLVLNSCRYIGETEPHYADGHRRGMYYGVKEEIPPLITRYQHTESRTTHYSSSFVTRDHMMAERYRR